MMLAKKTEKGQDLENRKSTSKIGYVDKLISEAIEELKQERGISK